MSMDKSFEFHATRTIRLTVLQDDAFKLALSLLPACRPSERLPWTLPGDTRSTTPWAAANLIMSMSADLAPGAGSVTVSQIRFNDGSLVDLEDVIGHVASDMDELFFVIGVAPPDPASLLPQAGVA